MFRITWFAAVLVAVAALLLVGPAQATPGTLDMSRSSIGQAKGVLSVVDDFADALVLQPDGKLASSALGGPPPPKLANIAVTHARPVAGQKFTGVTITKADAGIEQVLCAATIRDASLHAFKQRYYAPVVGLAAVTCRWTVPKAARGILSTQISVVTSKGNLTAPVVSWHIRSRRPVSKALAWACVPQ